MDRALVCILLKELADGDLRQFSEDELNEAVAWLKAGITVTPRVRNFKDTCISPPQPRKVRLNIGS